MWESGQSINYFIIILFIILLFIRTQLFWHRMMGNGVGVNTATVNTATDTSATTQQHDTLQQLWQYSNCQHQQLPTTATTISATVTLQQHQIQQLHCTATHLQQLTTSATNHKQQLTFIYFSATSSATPGSMEKCKQHPLSGSYFQLRWNWWRSCGWRQTTELLNRGLSVTWNRNVEWNV